MIKSFVLTATLAFSTAAQAHIWKPDYGLWEVTNRPFPVRTHNGLTFKQCNGLLWQYAQKTLGFLGSCKSQTVAPETVMTCRPKEDGSGYQFCHMVGSGPRPLE
jgi:hypothetical protein